MFFLFLSASLQGLGQFPNLHSYTLHQFIVHKLFEFSQINFIFRITPLHCCNKFLCSDSKRSKHSFQNNINGIIRSCVCVFLCDIFFASSLKLLFLQDIETIVIVMVNSILSYYYLIHLFVLAFCSLHTKQNQLSLSTIYVVFFSIFELQSVNELMVGG